MTGWPQKPPLGCQIDWGDPLARGLVACWLMNEGGGNKIYDLIDLTGNGNTGAITNAVWAPGKFGCCLSFDGDGDYVLMNAVSAVNPNVNFSISGSFYARDNATTQAIYASKDGAGNFGIFVGGGLLKCGFFTTGWVRSCSGSISANTWYSFVYGVKNSTGFLFINAINQTGTTMPGFAGTTAGVARIGCRAVIDYFFNGLIDNVQIWNRALTAAEVDWLYREPFAMIRRPRLELWTPAIDVGGGLLVHPGMSGGVRELCGGICA